MLPDSLVKLATAIVLGIAVTHPMTFALELRKIELRILREASGTRSWGNPDIFQYTPPKEGADPFRPERGGPAVTRRAPHAQ